MSTLYEYIRNSELPKLIFQENEINISGSRLKLLKNVDHKFELKLLRYDNESGTYKKRNSTVQVLQIDEDIDVDDILYDTFNFNYSRQLFSILRTRENKTKKISISTNHQGISFNRSVLKINNDKLKELIADAERIAKQSNSYRKSTELYFTNRAAEKHLGIEIKSPTNVKKGEFDLLVRKLNLQNKSKKDDLKKYINKSDLLQLESLCDFLIKKEAFSEKFLQRLDDYFIKEKLQFIIDIGEEILSLKSEDIKTDAAKAVIEKFTNVEIKQLESVWQKYFEKFLLHLIFSYRSFHPKVKFNDVDGEKKFPDFIGVNHYGGVDIIEIKTHLKEALIYDSSHKNYAFSGELSKAIIQTMNYMDLLIKQKFNTEETNQEILNYLLDQNVYRPRGIIIISSDNKLVKSMNRKNEAEKKTIIRDFTKLRNSLNNIEILTFNEVIDTARNYTENIINES